MNGLHGRYTLDKFYLTWLQLSDVLSRVTAFTVESISFDVKLIQHRPVHIYLFRNFY